jgi:hypothetical protein
MPTTMKNSLNDLFRERFQGHEAPVDPGTWAVIEAKLLTAAPASDPVNDLFRDRFQNHESAVDPSVWSGISSQLGHPVAGGGWASAFGWMAAGVAGVVAVGALVFALNSNPAKVAEAAPAPQPENLLQPVLMTESEEAPRPEPEDLLSTSVPERRSSLQPAKAQTPDSPIESVETASASAPAAEEAVVVDQIIEDLTVRTMLEVLGSEPVATPLATQPEKTEGNAPGGEVQPLETTVPMAEESIKLFMPNTFTPNGDGINDTYRILPRQGFSGVLVRVYSMKNNQLVFSSASIDDEWQGLNCDDGMYLVAVEAITLGGRVVADGKVVWLNRGSTN